MHGACTGFPHLSDFLLHLHGGDDDQNRKLKVWVPEPPNNGLSHVFIMEQGDEKETMYDLQTFHMETIGLGLSPGPALSSNFLLI